MASIYNDILTIPKPKYFEGSDQHTLSLVKKIRHSIIDIVNEKFGSEKVEELKLKGLSKLHEIIPLNEYASVEMIAKDRTLIDCQNYADRYCRDVLGYSGDLYVCSLVMFRIHAPYRQARSVKNKVEKPSLKKSVKHLIKGIINYRNAYSSERTIDLFKNVLNYKKAYNPDNYQKGIIRNGRSHGIHIDTWHANSFNALNLWVAIDGVNEMNSVAFYPEMYGHIKGDDFDPDNMYLKEGIRVTEPFVKEMAPGEVVVFNAEIPHSTIVNVSDQTRIALTMRVADKFPKYNFASSERNWNNSWAVTKKAGQKLVFNNLKVEPGSENNKPLTKNPPEMMKALEIDSNFKESTAENHIKVPAKDVPKSSETIVLKFNDLDVILTKNVKGKLFCFSSRCPHLGVSLIDGYSTGNILHCPGHALKFDKATGLDSSGCFKLRSFPAKLSDGKAILHYR